MGRLISRHEVVRGSAEVQVLLRGSGSAEKYIENEDRIKEKILIAHPDRDYQSPDSIPYRSVYVSCF
jgi:hypothetical protein